MIKRFFYMLFGENIRFVNVQTGKYRLVEEPPRGPIRRLFFVRHWFAGLIAIPERRVWGLIGLALIIGTIGAAVAEYEDLEAAFAIAYVALGLYFGSRVSKYQAEFLLKQGYTFADPEKSVTVRARKRWDLCAAKMNSRRSGSRWGIGLGVLLGSKLRMLMRSRICHQCGHLARLGAAYCGKCGEHLPIRRVWKVGVGAAVVLLISLYAADHLHGFSTGGAPPDADHSRDFSTGGIPPRLAVFFNSGGLFRTIRIVSHDDRAVIVQRVVINNKEGDPDCDIMSQTAKDKDKASEQEESKSGDPEAYEFLKSLSESPLPATLTLSDSVSIIASSVCNDPVKVTVYTQLGSAVYDFN